MYVVSRRALNERHESIILKTDAQSKPDGDSVRRVKLHASLTIPITLRSTVISPFFAPCSETEHSSAPMLTFVETALASE